MVDERKRGSGRPTSTGATRSSPAFNTWLQAQLKARRLTQRQLAQKSGVDHSTVSRLVRGDRVPSLYTAARLARALGWPDGIGSLDDRIFGASSSATARVEYALRSDDMLDERRVQAIMDVYLAARARRSTGTTKAAPGKPTGRTPVPIVTSVGLRPSARTGVPPAGIRKT